MADGLFCLSEFQLTPRCSNSRCPFWITTAVRFTLSLLIEDVSATRTTVYGEKIALNIAGLLWQTASCLGIYESPVR